ncbi:glycosyl transferase family 2 [Aureimonas endophytica]|uniref:Glycosyl transferase family 2 n=1 Tax=Aureimonas endophytica TaxID=2027858 RepID=A0A917A4D9_9HYPH|nr:nucleotidyltransferase [Aureimonas endophytica]GGE24485.1 glycosyl transferase family 2 [Aureimonas endophytica]
MNILIPMAGAGSRFVDAGYALHKPVIPVSSRRQPRQVPMVVAAVEDLPVAFDAPDTDLHFVIRDFHRADGVDELLRARFPRASFTVVDRLTEGQASTCLLARDAIDTSAPLLIAACDNGMDVDPEAFRRLSAEADALIFTFRGNEAVLAKPSAYGWIRTEGERVTDVSIKVPISDNPMRDHAVVGTFWFRHGHDFVRAAEEMIAANDRINDEFYVDQIFRYMVRRGLDVRVVEISRYVCWGTPADYESFEKSLAYWTSFVEKEPWL